MLRYRSIFPRAKPVIYIHPGRPRRRTRIISPAVRLIAATSIALAVVAGVMASGRAHETCTIGPGGSSGDESRPVDLGHWEGCAQPPITLVGSTRP